MGRMETPNAKSALENDLVSLERWLDELIRTVERLKEENRSLRQQQQALAAERAGLIQKNELARNRIEAMISQLKSMEQGA
ncbi:MAG: TIGR02449 family protein [Gammaproteobacteria bacterium]